jgi:AraC-like DNA-binding protein
MNGELTFLHGHHIPRCVATVDKRFGYYALQLMARGRVAITYDGQAYDLRGAWLWPCAPGPWIHFHEQPAGHPWDHRYIAFSGERAAAWRGEGLWPAEPQEIARAHLPRVVALFDRMLKCVHEPGRLAHLGAVNALEALLLDRAADRRGLTPTPPSWLAGVTAALADASGIINYRDLAKAQGMSLTSLRRRFRLATGQSLHQFHLACRLARARELLGDGNQPLKAVAAALGYRDAFYFSRQFRALAGVAPGAYRRSRQG